MITRDLEEMLKNFQYICLVSLRRTKKDLIGQRKIDKVRKTK